MLQNKIFPYLLVLFSVTVAADNPTVTVDTNNGPVIGKLEHTVNKGTPYAAFYGLPYAQPPVGDLRFKEPQPPNNWTGIWDATIERDACTQSIVTNVRFARVFGSEDCLYVNVYSTELSGDKPVMVWIHGGGFIDGARTYEYYGPDFLIEEGVVLVTVGYRLGIFGWYSTEDSAAPGNYGLKDQIMALKWIQANIRDFGGNPDKVTIVGHSAGGVSVSYLTQTPSAQGLFHRAIIQSGSSLATWSIGKGRNLAFKTGKMLGIDTEDPAELTEKLRKFDYKTLHLQASTIALVDFIPHAFEGLVFGPVIEAEHPGAVITESSYELLNSGQFNKVPTIIGFTALELVALYPYDFVWKLYMNVFQLNPSKLVPVSLNIEDESIKSTVGGIIKKRYFKDENAVIFSDEQFLDVRIFPIPTTILHFFVAIYNRLQQFASESMFVRPSVEQARLMSKYSDVYIYQLSYLGYLGNTERPANGVGHGEELNYLFYRLSQPYLISEKDNETRQRMLRLWTNFAKCGNPTPEEDNLLQGITWPVASSTDKLTYLDINDNLDVLTDPHKEDTEFWRDIFAKHGQPPYKTY